MSCDSVISYYLKIAGFLIKISLLNPKIEKSRIEFGKMITTSFSGFIIKPEDRNLKPDFSINVKSSKTEIYYGKANSAFVKIYDRSVLNVITYYSISMHQLQLILMQVIFWLLSDQGSIFHCSAVNIKGKAVVFMGKQGAGKTTASALLSSKYEVLADDNGIIRLEGCQFYFYQSPGLEKNESISKKSAKYLLDTIYFLRKSRSFAIKRIGGKQYFLNRLIAQWLGDPRGFKKKLKFLLKLTNSFNRIKLLFFDKNEEKLIELIENDTTK